MCSSETFTPHREQPPPRYCESCSALLSSRNATDTCYQCVPSWSPPTMLSELLSSETMEALALLMAEEPVAA